MTLSEKKEKISSIKRIIANTSGRRSGIKFTYAEIFGPFLQITHSAGATDGNFKIIDERLIQMGLPTLAELKETFEITQEKGSPTNHYLLEVRMKAVDRNKVKMIRARKMENIPNKITA